MADSFSMGGLFGDGMFAYVDGDLPSSAPVGNQRQWIPVRIKQAIIAGGAAGDHTVTGITEASILLAVTQYVGAGVAVTDLADLTTEFTITADDTINNTGGTDTTGSKLQVWYLQR